MNNITFDTKTFTLREISEYINNKDFLLGNCSLPNNKDFIINNFICGYKYIADVIQNENGTLSILDRNDNLYCLYLFFNNMLTINGLYFKDLNFQIQRAFKRNYIIFNILDRRNTEEVKNTYISNNN